MRDVDTSIGTRYYWDMTNTNNGKATWKFQTDNDANGQTAVHVGYATDARGLRLRAECGYGWVNMGDGWLQLSVAIRKLEIAERAAQAVSL